MTSFEPRSGTKPHRFRAQRAAVSLPSSMVTLSAYQFPELANISQTGARLCGPSLPRKGATGLLKAGALEVLCTVVWVKDGQCGVRFDEAVSPNMLKRLQLDGAVTIASC